MKKSVFAVLFVLLTLTACQRDDTFEPVAELPFSTHPSVLRGNWSGTILSFPAEQDVALELIDLVATCEFPDGDECYSYTFEGNISIAGGTPVPVTGQGYAESYIYTLTSPVEPAPPLILATFESNGVTWSLNARYSGLSPVGETVAYQGDISTRSGDRKSGFRLEPTP